MNVRILNADSAFIRNLQPDKIVSVKVIKREEGTAIIEINGFKTSASVDAKAPDNFFALVEPGISENGLYIMKLRILTPLARTQYFLDKKEYNLLQSIKSILIEQNLPLSDDFFETSRIIYKTGMKLDKAIIKTVHLAFIKHGEGFAGLIADLIGKGIRVDSDFIDFFFNFKKALDSIGSSFDQGKGGPDIPGILQGLFRMYFGPGSGYNISMFGGDVSGGGQVTQWRKEKKENQDLERYYFDFSNDSTGSFIIVTDCFKTGYRIEVYLDGDFIALNREKLDGFSIGPGNISIAFIELKNPYLFWTGKDCQENTGREAGLFNLDISV